MRASLISVALILTSFSITAQAKSLEKTMEDILTLNQNGNIAVSVEMHRVSDGKRLYSLNPETVLTPASTTKIVLSTTLLAKLGPYFKMQTRFYRTGSFGAGIAHGDLIVVGDGDPFLVSERLFLIASDLRAQGYRKFTGDLVLDNSLFAEEAYSDEQNKGQGCALRSYDAPVSALGVNFNALSVAISPGENVGDPAFASLNPFPLRGVKIKNNIKTVVKANTPIQFDCKVPNKGQWEISLSGQISNTGPVQYIYRVLPDTSLLNGEQIRSLLEQFGITIQGKIREGKVDEKAKLILTYDSKPLSELLKGLGEFSNNYMADMLLKRLAVAQGRVGTFSEGVHILEEFLHGLGIKNSFVLKDGSGLSYQTRLSAAQLTRILLYAAQDFRIFPDFLASLPSGGKTGTLKKRFQFEEVSALQGNIRAKTGRLSSPILVSALAGYFQHESYGLVAFTILHNGVKGKPQPRELDLHRSQESALAYFGKNFKGIDHGL
jgi:D-alanyl-D-alanine carboxypeptidase/D-alanyl-D-alanine-endopeptidase (penicillin-binding protein 4)